jgi:hypothetical protein
MPSWRSVSVVVAAVAAFAVASEPADLARRLESLTSEWQGAGYATRKRLLESLRADVDGRRGVIQGPVTNVTTFRLDDVAVDGTPRGRSSTRWEHGGLVLESPPWSDSRERLSRHLGGASTGSVIVIRSGSTLVYALASAPAVVDRVRVGQRVSATIEVVGLFESTFFGMLLEIDSGADMLACPNGHAFPVDSGYRFCPFDGEPLATAAEPSRPD